MLPAVPGNSLALRAFDQQPSLTYAPMHFPHHDLFAPFADLFAVGFDDGLEIVEVVGIGFEADVFAFERHLRDRLLELEEFAFEEFLGGDLSAGGADDAWEVAHGDELPFEPLRDARLRHADGLSQLLLTTQDLYCTLEGTHDSAGD